MVVRGFSKYTRITITSRSSNSRLTAASFSAYSCAAFGSWIEPIKAAADSCFAAGFEHHFLSINLDGRVISAETKGNPDCHLVLRGSSHGPNYDAESVRQALEDLKVSKASGPSQHGLVIDAAHGNCGKDENREAEVIEEIAERLAHGEQGITGVMMESFLVGGHQKPAPLDQLVYGQSVTDSCVPWERTNELLHTLADAVTARRSAK